MEGVAKHWKKDQTLAALLLLKFFIVIFFAFISFLFYIN